MTRQLVQLRGIGITRDTRLPILFLSAPGSAWSIPVPIDPSEASSIILQMEGMLPLRPLTHDLLASLFHRHGFRLRCVELYGQVDNELLARIRYTHGVTSHAMEVRPSDGVALALRLCAPIFCTEDAMDLLAVPGDPEHPSGIDDRDFLYLDADCIAQSS